MTLKNIARAGCVLGLTGSAALGFSSGPGALTRSVSGAAALTNTPIVVTAVFTNGGPAALRGFYFSDQLPAGVELVPLGVLCAGQAVTNYTFTSGNQGDLQDGCAPCRWVLEQPTNFAELNPIPAAAAVQITYAITSRTPGEFELPRCNWAGHFSSPTNAVFGYSEDSERLQVRFLAIDAPPMVAVSLSTNRHVTVALTGVPNLEYAIETSTNLFHWIPLATNPAPFSLAVSNAAAGRQSFFRGRRP